MTPSLHTSTLLVTQADTAEALGSGDLPVLATPRMMALMENAAMLAVADQLESGQTTVGAEICVKHLRPTPTGAVVTATAVLTAAEGRKLSFSISAHQDGTLIGEGTHTRFIVDARKFLSKLQASPANAAGPAV